MAHPPASAPSASSKRRKHTPTASTIPKPPTTTLTAHFARLTAIWALDRRIPTPASRAAWAAARGLDAEKVHKWWYRCRARARKTGVVIPEGSYEMEVGDVEAEVEEERRAREEKARRRRVRVKKEVAEVDMRREEEAQEEVKGEGDTAHVPLASHTLAAHSSLLLAQILMEVDEAMTSGGDDAEAIRKASAVTQSPPLTLSQCFLPPSSPYTSPPPRSAPSPPASPPPLPDLPRLTRASKRLYIHALESVLASDSVKLDPLGDANCISAEAPVVGSHQTLQRLPLAESRNDNIQRVCVPKAKELKPAATKAKKCAPRPAKTTIIPPKFSNPSRKGLAADPPTISPRAAPAPSLSFRATADIDITDPIPTPADLERALYEGITFERCVDISLSAVLYIFGLDACGFQFGFGGGGGSGSGVGAMGGVNALDGDIARAMAADDVNVNGPMIMDD
ncbi:hypothetical protein DFP72DRAFT_859524 [Ephemerocybe angulata]|uniref:Uncharacterized protein n=1 Tax=Ephemerocybe angulata TaxID=980116 RepID=A0A8H6HA21_9AGAR|nr:hypothetical protein DFP72DRAFT_859524 [Tulosesus angulatus]